MNEKETRLNSLMHEYQVPVKKRCQCAYYLFCCCFCNKKDQNDTREFYINKWRKYLSKETDSKKKLNDPFRILTNLWAHKNVIKDLELIRLNPNLISKNKIRNDLEFYIPQICTFLLFGEYEIVEEFLAFLCKACFASFFFAHRIVWFLKSMINTQNTCNEKIKDILHIIQTIYKSEKDKNMLERLHVAGSKKFMEYLTRNNYLSLYSSGDLIKNISYIPRESNLIPMEKEEHNMILANSGVITLSDQRKEETKEKVEEEKESGSGNRKSTIEIFEKNNALNKSRNSSGNSASIENNNQKMNINSSISFEENLGIKPNSNVNNNNQEQDNDLKSLNNYADKINFGRNIIYNFSDLEYRHQINREKADSIFADTLQTNPNSDQDSNKNLNNPKEADTNKDNNVNNLSNINFLKSTREKEASLFKYEKTLDLNNNNNNKNNENNLKNSSDSLKKDIGNQFTNDDQTTKKNSSTNGLSVGESLNESLLTYLNADNIFINIFKNYERVSNDEINFSTQYIKHIDSQDINLSSFLSNINFVDHLCNICIILESMPIHNQHRTLLNELNKVNKNLPSNTYIPFLRDSIRNYVVCHIPISEAKIFKTKNRSPYMITLECIRLEEVNYLLREEEINAKAMNFTNIPLTNQNTLNLEQTFNASAINQQNSKSLSNEDEGEISDDNSMLINLKKFNVKNIKEIKGFNESNSFRINNINKESLINKSNKLNGSNSAGNIGSVHINPLPNKFFKDDFQIKNSPTQREKKKKYKLRSIFSDFFSSNNDKKNRSLDYNSFQDANTINLEMGNKSNYTNILNKKESAPSFYNKKFKQDEKKFSLIEGDSNNIDAGLNAQNEINNNNNNLNNEIDISENENKLRPSPLDKVERQYSSSFSSNSESNRIDKQNYILESEINLSKPIAIKNILNAGSNNNNKEETKDRSTLKGVKSEKNKFSRSKIKEFIKEKILKNKNSASDAISKNNDYKNLYENLKFNYSDFENDTIKNEKTKTGKYSSNEEQRKNRVNSIESEVDYETDPEDLRKIDEVVKREVILHSPKGREKSSIDVNEDKLNVPISKLTFNNKPNNLIDLNVNVNQNKKYNNLVEEELDAEASSNTDEDNMSDANNNFNDKSIDSSIDKKTSFISIKLNDAENSNNPNNEDSIITKINQLDGSNLDRINNSGSSTKRKSFDFITKNASNNNKNLLEELDQKTIKNINVDNNSNNSTINASQFPKFEEIFGEKIETQTQKLKQTSPFGHFETFTLFKVIVKNGEDLRQEQFATQLINEFHQIFKLEKVDCWVNTYEILATGNNAGLIEVVPNAISLDQLKRKAKGINSLRHFFEVYYGPENGKRFKHAMKNFISSLAGYSLVCYFLQIKDRHNANILIDDAGHLIHIDFGFMFTNAPGKGLKFEKAPFKLTKEFVDVMGGVNSKNFQKFRKLLWKGFVAIVNNYEKILILVEMMYCGHGNKLPCFEKGHITIDELRSRFIPKEKMKTRDYIKLVDNLIEQSIDNWRTKWYDKYQYWVQGIFY